MEIGSPVGCVPTIDPYFGTPPRQQVCIGQIALVALQASKSRLLTSGGHINRRRFTHRLIAAIACGLKLLAVGMTAVLIHQS